MLSRKIARQLIAVIIVLLLAGQVAGAAGYTVRHGDTLWLISQRYNQSVDLLRRVNKLPDPNLLNVGQTLQIPDRVYRIKPGDTLFNIARQYGLTLAAMTRANNLATPGLIYPGQLLAIPAAEEDEGGSRSRAASPASVSRAGGAGLSAAELDLFARIVHAESAGEPYIGQVAVAATILNRMASSRYPSTLSGVVYHVVDGYYQYSPVLDGRINLPANQTARQAVADAQGGWDPSGGALGFYNPRKTTNQWVRQQPVTTVIGNHIFFR